MTYDPDKELEAMAEAIKNTGVHGMPMEDCLLAAKAARDAYHKHNNIFMGEEP